MKARREELSFSCATFAANQKKMKEALPWFKEWFNSPYYHQLYFERDEQEAAEFIDNLIEYLKPGADASMLDVACGKGRHSVQLAGKGFDVTGIDLSQESIKEAKQFENDHLHFYVHDMRLPFRSNYFDYVFNFFTSFGYFDTWREHENAIRTIAQCLKDRGIFVMDYLNVRYAEKNTIHKSDILIDDVNFHITKWYDEEHFFKKIEVEDPKRTEPLIHTEKVAKFSLGDFTELFAFQHMQILEVFGDYHFSNFNMEKSPRLIMIVKKLKSKD